MAMTATTPAITTGAAAGSLKYALTDARNLYLAAGRGFETPLSMNFLIALTVKRFSFDNLKPSTNDTVEVGSKTRTAMAC